MSNILDGLFESWKRDVYETMGTSRFTAKGRQGPLEDLVQSLVEKNIDYDTACSLSYQLKTCLVTKKGATGSGNYKNWKENVEAEYKGILYEVYNAKGLVPNEDGGTPNSNAPTEATVSVGMFEQHGLIELWGNKVFGNVWCRELNDLAHTKDSSLHNRFLDELFC